MVVGALWAGIVAVLKVTRGVSEVISSIMLNFIALGLASFLLTGPFRGSAEGAPIVSDDGRSPSRAGSPASTGSSTGLGLAEPPRRALRLPARRGRRRRR